MQKEEYKKGASPCKLLEKFNPRPCDELQDKMDYYYFPYQINENFSKYMKFDNEV